MATISVIIRAKNDAALISKTLDGIARGRRQPDEIIAIDSGSTDGTREILAGGVDRLIDILPESYIPGAVLNLGVSEASGDIVVFNNSDCEPVDENWLAELVAPIEAGAADVTFGAQAPRPDAREIVVKDHARAYGDGRTQAQWGDFFSVATAAFRRDVLVAAPFDSSITYSEDLAWFMQNRSQYIVQYAPTARVYHSHNYTLRQTWRRFRGEGRADAQIFGAQRSRRAGVVRAVGSAFVESARDAVWCLRRRRPAAFLPSLPHRLTQRLAYRAGFQLGMRAAGRIA
jgi:glycosyltransferase involved in cell wall biosynthesis